MKKNFTAVLFIFLLLLLKTNIVRAQINQQDSLALVDLYNSTKGPKWQPNNWLTAAPVSTWTGVTVAGNRVTEIDLTNSGLNGRIPESFGNLTALKTFSANYGVKGALPSSIGNVTALQSLAIYFCNDFNGHLPWSIGNLKNLETLYLYSDNISGTIPGSMGNLSKLKWLILVRNLLKGNIPASLNKLINLESLDLSFNRLSGTIPPLNHLTKLSDLRLQFNAFTFAGLENIVENFPFAGYWPQRNIALNNNTNTLSVYAGGANALQDNTYKWYKGSTLVATITGDSTFTLTQSGNYSVTVTNAVATALTLYSDTVYYNAGNNAIASKMNNHSFIAVYPNPAKTNATVSFNAEGRYTLTITDMAGNILQTRTGVANKDETSIRLDVSNYASGMYLITIMDEKGRKQTLRLNKE